jgi:succinate-acetate transporter protein
MENLQQRWTPAGPVTTRQEREDLTPQMARAKTSTGEPIPLGLLGFATATFTAGTVIAGWWPQSSMSLVVPVLLIFGGIAQFVAAMWSYANADTLAATAFGSFGAFNTTFAIFFLLQHSGALGPVVSLGPQAVWIACFAFIAFYLAFAALSRSTGLVAVLFTLAVGYALLSAGYFAMQPNNTSILYHVSGWFLIISSVIAFYVATAVTVNSSFRTKVLPMGSPREVRRGQELVSQQS